MYSLSAHILLCLRTFYAAVAATVLDQETFSDAFLLQNRAGKQTDFLTREMVQVFGNTHF
jgi:hypothetical protein